MKVKIKIPGKAISTNARLKPARTGRFGKMRLVKNDKQSPREREIEMLLIKYNRELWALGLAFDIKKHFFFTSYKFVYAKKEFWTKKKQMNSKLLDADNAIKKVKDMIFERIGVNDRLSRKEMNEVSPGQETFFEIEIELREWASDLPAEMLP